MKNVYDRGCPWGRLCTQRPPRALVAGRAVARAGARRSLGIAVLATAVLGAGLASVARAQAAGQPPGGEAAAQLPPPQPIPVPKKPVPPPTPLHWWCEINALPAADSILTPDQADRNFFMSQIVERPPRVGPEEEHEVVRICRTAFEVQFGGQWRLVTARAQRALTLDAARLNRLQDLRVGNHEGHEQSFRIPDWHG
jgi:hypothetical protein